MHEHITSADDRVQHHSNNHSLSAEITLSQFLSDIAKTEKAKGDVKSLL